MRYILDKDQVMNKMYQELGAYGIGQRRVRQHCYGRRGFESNGAVLNGAV